ncbi:MAG: hypothetical protein GY861_01630 [bacterium]|nr:hypothetical protein [bacterium]
MDCELLEDTNTKMSRRAFLRMCEISFKPQTGWSVQKKWQCQDCKLGRLLWKHGRKDLLPDNVEWNDEEV